MSKYIESRKLKILELSQELSIINNRIDSYISFLNNFKQSLHSNQHSIMFHLDETQKEFQQGDNKIVFKKFNIKLMIYKEYIGIFFNDESCYFYNNKLPLYVFNIASTIIYQINQEISFDNILKDIKQAELLYNTIIKIEEEIQIKNSGFIEKSNFILKNIKNTFLSNHKLDHNNHTSFYIINKQKADKTLFIKKSDSSNYHFSIIIPDQISLFKQHNIDIYNFSDTNKNLMLTLYKEEFFKLNPYIKNLLLPIKFGFSHRITGMNRYVYLIFSITDIYEKEIDIIYEQLQLNEQLKKF